MHNHSTQQKMAAAAGVLLFTSIGALALNGTASGQTTEPPSTIYDQARSAQAQAAPATAQVRGVQITTTTLVVAKVAIVEAAPVTAKVLGTQVAASDVALTGSNSQSSTAIGIALTAAGGVLIAASRRGRRTRAVRPR